MQLELGATRLSTQMRVLVDVVDSVSVERACTPFDAMHLVAFLQQQFCQIGTILPGNAGYKCDFRFLLHELVMEGDR